MQYIDSQLNFTDHVAHLAVKGYRMTNLILKCFKLRDSSCLVRAFITYVRPRLEYCSVAWNSLLVKNIEELEKVQRRFTEIAIDETAHIVSDFLHYSWKVWN